MNLSIKELAKSMRVLIILTSKLLNHVLAALVMMVGNTLHNKVSECVCNSINVL